MIRLEEAHATEFEKHHFGRQENKKFRELE